MSTDTDEDPYAYATGEELRYLAERILEAETTRDAVDAPASPDSVSPEQLAICHEAGCDPADFVQLRRQFGGGR